MSGPGQPAREPRGESSGGGGDPAGREFLETPAGVAGAALLPRTAAEIPVLPGYAPKVTGFWIPKGEHEKSLALVRKLVDATTDFS